MMGWFRRSESAKPQADAPAQKDPVTVLFESEARRLHPRLSADDAWQRLVDAYSYLIADGEDLDLRLAVESRILADLDPEALSIRLEHVSLPRIDPYPDDLDEAILWICDVLRAERADVAAGRIPLEAAIAAAAFDRGAIPEHLKELDLRLGAGPSRASDDDVARAVQQIILMPDRLLVQRFRHVPGVDEKDIPPPYRDAERREWIATAMRAMETRELCGLAPLRDTALPLLAGLHVGMIGIDLHTTSQGTMAFSGILRVENSEICAVTSPGDGTIEGSRWRHGYAQRDLDHLEQYMQVAMPPVADERGERPCTLLDVLLDQVQTHAMLTSYRIASADTVLFCVDAGGDDIELLAVPVPEGGTREGAVQHVQSSYAEVVFLDEMEEMDAALLWLSLS